MYEATEDTQANSAYHPIYECSNTKQLIIFTTPLWAIPSSPHGVKQSTEATSEGGQG